MALAKTAKAIGAVTDALVQRLGTRTGFHVTVGRPEPPASPPAGDRLNLFLYEVQFDPSLKNVPLDEGQRPPLWLVLKYLMTAFDTDSKTSETLVAYENLGAGIRALQELSVLSLAGLPAALLDALGDNPEDLKLTFEDTPADLLSKVTQGSDEKYRLSVGFQVRPVMIAAPELPAYALLVGVDYTTTPVTKVGEQAIHIPVLPSLGPTITDIAPAGFVPGDTVTIYGGELHLANLSVSLGAVELPLTMQQPDQAQFVISAAAINGGTISAGSLPLAVSQLLVTGRRRASNLLVAHLLPTLDSVTVGPPPDVNSTATLDLTGQLLGAQNTDDCYLALFKDGATVKLLDDATDTSPPNAPQTQRRFVIKKTDAVPPGAYLVLYRVNGQQAQQGIGITLT